PLSRLNDPIWGSKRYAYSRDAQTMSSPAVRCSRNDFLDVRRVAHRFPNPKRLRPTDLHRKRLVPASPLLTPCTCPQNSSRCTLQRNCGAFLKAMRETIRYASD